LCSSSTGTCPEKECASGEQGVEHGPERVEIAALRDGFAGGLFGRQVLRGPNHRTRHRERVAAKAVAIPKSVSLTTNGGADGSGTMA
jgi:hypothetical protein